ncbi:hypothetical protein KY312_01560, partial [Candidatus Woesearchaeota archaeon]|nr:hypothetical protein [Candidatus Woesearchaeota archaeon]
PNIYLQDNYRFVKKGREPFDEFITKKNVSMIVVSQELEENWSSDNEFQSFLNNPEGSGFIKMHINGTEKDLYVNKDFINI